MNNTNKPIFVFFHDSCEILYCESKVYFGLGIVVVFHACALRLLETEINFVKVPLFERKDDASPLLILLTPHGTGRVCFEIQRANLCAGQRELPFLAKTLFWIVLLDEITIVYIFIHSCYKNSYPRNTAMTFSLTSVHSIFWVFPGNQTCWNSMQVYERACLIILK